MDLRLLRAVARGRGRRHVRSPHSTTTVTSAWAARHSWRAHRYCCYCCNAGAHGGRGGQRIGTFKHSWTYSQYMLRAFRVHTFQAHAGVHAFIFAEASTAGFWQGCHRQLHSTGLATPGPTSNVQEAQQPASVEIREPQKGLQARAAGPPARIA